MKKGYQMIVKAIEVTKKYNQAEVKQLSGLFTYLNAIDIDEEGFKTGVSAKGLWKLLAPLTRTGKQQEFREWWESVSNLSRLKENIDYKVSDEIIIKKVENKAKIEDMGIFPNPQKTKFRGIVPIKDKDYILTLRAGEYCAVLTKGDSGDLYRRFIFDIKDEFLRLVFREGKSIETRNEFTKSIGNLEFMKQLKEENPKEVGSVYGEVTNLIYLELFGVKAIEYKENNNISKKYLAKDFFTKDGLLDLEKLENKLAVIIEYLEPKTKDDLKKVIVDFLNKEIKWK